MFQDYYANQKLVLKGFAQQICNYQMFFTPNTTAITSHIITPASFFEMKQAPPPACFQGLYDFSQQNRNSESTGQQKRENSKQLFQNNRQKDSFSSPDAWAPSQIEQLFKLYDCYGPQWKVMSQQTPSRTANNLKNRFYTVLRNLIKLLFKKKADVCPKLSGEISSKDLSRLYDGKQNYEEFKHLVSTILKELNYNLCSKRIDDVVRSHSIQIIKVYQTIFREKFQSSVANPQNLQNQEQISKIEPEEKSLKIQFPFVENFPSQGKNPLDSAQAGKKDECGSRSSQSTYVYFFYFPPTYCGTGAHL